MSDPTTRPSMLLRQVQQQFATAISPALSALFDDFEWRLFELAERSRAPSQQHSYFDGLRECRRKRGGIELDFLERIEATMRPPASDRAALPHRSELSLVESDDLEETLALSALAERAQAQHEESLFGIEHRVALLTASSPRAVEQARLGPQALGRAFRKACQRLDVAIEVRLVAHALFGYHILDALGPVYAAINRSLIDAGVLPDLPPVPSQHRHPAQQPESRPKKRDPVTPPESEAPTPTKRTGPAPPGEAIADTQCMLDELRAMFADATHAPSGAPETARNAATAENGREFGTTFPVGVIADALEQMRQFQDEPRLLKACLIEATRRLAVHPQVRFVDEHEQMMDLVGLVFDFVRHDPDLPEPLQPLIARLQVPFLIASLGDPGLLRSAQHPAQRLLDDLGDLAIGWCPGSDPEHLLLERISHTVETLLSERELARAAFDNAIRDLQTHLEVGRRRAELAEQRSVEAALGRERLRIARRRVAATLHRSLQRCEPLPWIRQLLRGPWANYLVLLWLRQGETGTGFRTALGFIDELLWCDEHGPNSLDQARLAGAAETLEAGLRIGLSTVAYHDREIEQLAQEMQGFIGSLSSGAPLPAYLFEIDPALAAMDFAQTWAEQDLDEQPDPNQVDASLVARMRSLPPGTWFEFARPGVRERAKLSWSIPFSGLCLFVNRNGLKCHEDSPERLAADAARGTVRVIENTRLLQRALSNLLCKARNQGVAAMRGFA